MFTMEIFDLNGKSELGTESTWKSNILKFHHSYGYDSKRNFNLCALDQNTLAFVSGCYIHFLNIKTGICTFRRCSSKGGIGHMTTHPLESLFVVGESGDIPPILIYSWPSMNVIQKLEKGAVQSYSYLTFNADGELLASQSAGPDYMLIIWTWRNGEVLLRAKSHEQGAMYVIFSPYNTDQLITCGASHIKFWEMSQSFTGLKLLGELGKFGKTEACDIVSAYPLPSGDVVSGSIWGNILLWSNRVIELEVFRTGRRTCHNAPISQIFFHNNAIMTLCRLWSFWSFFYKRSIVHLCSYLFQNKR